MKSRYPLFYGSEFIERYAELRADHSSLMGGIHDQDALVIPVWRDLNLIQGNDDKTQLVSVNGQRWMIEQSIQNVFLGRYQERHVYTVDISHLESTEFKIEQGEFADLRKIGASLEATDASLAVYSRGIQYWHRTHGYCSRCGSITESTEGGHARICTSCEHTTYPRISPAVIVLVEHLPTNGAAPKCLLGKGQRSWGNIRSTLAGFVEVGETLEEAVKREMKEEAGIDVFNIRYMASQPWPFPSSLMVGFYAESSTLDIAIDGEEILEADWYTVKEMEDLVQQNKLTLSREDSIARYLIMNWIEKHS